MVESLSQLGKTKIMDIDDEKGQLIQNYLEATHSYAPLLRYGIFLSKEQRLVDYRNPIFSQLAVKLVNMLNPVKPKNILPAEVPNFLPIKIALIGSNYTGKKTLASKIAKKFKLAIFDIRKLVERSLQIVKIEEDKIQSDEANKEKKKVKMTGKKIENLELSEEDQKMFKIGYQIKQISTNFDEIPASLKLDIIMLQLSTFKHTKYAEVKSEFIERKSNNTKLLDQPNSSWKDLQTQKEDPKKGDKKGSAKTGKDKEGLKEKEGFEKKEDEEFNSNFPYLEGFILIGFPNTLSESRY